MKRKGFFIFHLFNVYMDELCLNLIQMEKDAPTINSIKISSLFWADDLVLISTTNEGLQNQLNVVNQYFSDWKLTLNTEKTKTIIFNKTGATLKKHQINYGGELIKTVKYFSYLGITLDSNGKFHTAINAQKMLRKLQRDYINYLHLITYPLKHC